MAMMYARDVAKKANKAHKAEQAKKSGKAEGDLRPVISTSFN